MEAKGFAEGLVRTSQGFLSRAWTFPQSSSAFETALMDPVRRTAFLLAKLPALAFFGVQINSVTSGRCEVVLPFTWRTQNPFGSVYFGAQVAAAELATGALILRGLAGHSDISMLVTAVEGTFTKKARGDIRFVCDGGLLTAENIEKVLAGGDSRFVLESVGTLADGGEVSRFKFTWSLKKKAEGANG